MENNNKNKILAVFILIFLLASCTKSNNDNTATETGVSLQEETRNSELFTEEEIQLIEENAIDIKETEVTSTEKEESVTTPKQVTIIKEDNTTPKQVNSTTTEVSTSTGDVKEEEIKVSEPIDAVKKLAINSKCIGCRHCVKFASSNFAIDNSTRKAIVISQENLDSTGVARAIGRCPVSAISLS